MRIYYFTGTGNSLSVAKTIGGELISIPQVKEYGTVKDDVIGIVFPVYGCTVPQIVKNFLAHMNFDAEYIFAICTYGNGKGKTMEIAEQIANENGYRFDYTNAILMVDNFLPNFDIEIQKEKLPEKKVDEQLSTIVADITARKCQTLKSSVGDKLGTWLCDKVLRLKYDDYALKNYSVDNSCIQCGTCVSICPSGNIMLKEKPEFATNCTGCMACVHACQKQAIHVKGEKNKVRWKNPDVSLAELIHANRQS